MTRHEEILLALVRSAMWGGIPERIWFQGAQSGTWEEVFALAKRGGVAALTFDATMRLPENLRPSRDLRIRWGLHAQASAERYARQRETAAHLASIFAEKDVKTMLLKGLSLARYYPEPALRECGDIDVWLYGDCEKGNDIARSLGLVLTEENPKHSTFLLNGVLVENHRTFLDEALYRMDKRLDKQLANILDTQPSVSLPDTNGLLNTPPPDFNALFLLRHASMHFPDGIALRHVVDWALFLHTEHKNIDADALRSTLRNEDLVEFAGILTAMARIYLNLNDTHSLLTHGPYEQQARRVMDSILAPKPVCKNPSRLSVFVFKTRRFLGSQWRYRIVYGPFSFPHRVWLSVKAHIARPETIFTEK